MVATTSTARGHVAAGVPTVTKPVSSGPLAGLTTGLYANAEFDSRVSTDGDLEDSPFSTRILINGMGCVQPINRYNGEFLETQFISDLRVGVNVEASKNKSHGLDSPKRAGMKLVQCRLALLFSQRVLFDRPTCFAATGATSSLFVYPTVGLLSFRYTAVPIGQSRNQYLGSQKVRRPVVPFPFCPVVQNGAEDGFLRDADSDGLY